MIFLDTWNPERDTMTFDPTSNLIIMAGKEGKKRQVAYQPNHVMIL